MNAAQARLPAEAGRDPLPFPYERAPVQVIRCAFVCDPWLNDGNVTHLRAGHPHIAGAGNRSALEPASDGAVSGSRSWRRHRGELPAR